MTKVLSFAGNLPTSVKMSQFLKQAPIPLVWYTPVQFYGSIMYKTNNTYDFYYTVAQLDNPIIVA
jgi:hypothetical protein